MDRPPDDAFIKGLTAKQLIDLRFGKGAYDRLCRQQRRWTKHTQELQKGRSWGGDQWMLALSIPSSIYYALEDVKPGCWDPDNRRETFAWLWEDYEDFRAVRMKDGRNGGNPFRPRLQSPLKTSTAPSTSGSPGVILTDA